MRPISFHDHHSGGSKALRQFSGGLRQLAWQLVLTSAVPIPVSIAVPVIPVAAISVAVAISFAVAIGIPVAVAVAVGITVAVPIVPFAIAASGGRNRCSRT
jgi:hypothetical protein